MQHLPHVLTHPVVWGAGGHSKHPLVLPPEGHQVRHLRGGALLGEGTAAKEGTALKEKTWGKKKSWWGREGVATDTTK